MKVSECAQCTGCILRDRFPDRNLIPPTMGPSLRIIVGEAGGKDEAIQGIPFVGPSGRMLDSFLRKAGISRAALSVANTLSCQPPNNIYPTDAKASAYCTDEEGEQIVQHCYEHHLKPVLDSRPWTRIDAVGNHALKVLTGKTEGIMKWRGSPLPLVGCVKPTVIALLHPQYLNRDSAMIPATISDLAKSVQVPEQHYNLQPTMEDLENFHADTLYCDIETVKFTNKITMVGIASRPYHVIVVPFHGAYVAQLKRIFLEANRVVNQNIIAFDLPILADNGVKIRPDCEIFDTMLLHHLAEPDAPHDLEYIASICTSMVAWKHLKNQDEAWYNACDVDAVSQIFAVLLPRVKYLKLLDLYQTISHPIALICKLMHDTGIKIDPNRLKVKRAEFMEQFIELESKIPEELKPYDKVIRVRKKAPAGTLGKSGKPIKFIHVPGTERVVPWNSPDMVARYLYETLGLPKQLHKDTKKVTTNKLALARLARQTHDPRLDSLRKLKGLDELLSTFLKGDDDDKVVPVERIHSNFLVHGTCTGRLSSSNPNLQNIPYQARYIYVPTHADWCFIEADFSSLENRLAAWYADDQPRLARLAVPGFNEHLWLARQIYGEQITKDDPEYKLGKITNHGCLIAGHEVLTPQGWINVEKYVDQPIAEWNNGQISFRTPSAFINKLVNEDLLEFTGRAFNAIVTKDHTFPHLSLWNDTTYVTKKRADSFSKGNMPITGYLSVVETLRDSDIQKDIAIQADATLQGNRATFHLVKARKQMRLESLFSVKGRDCGCHVGGKIYHVDVPYVVLDHDKNFTTALLSLSLRQRNLFLQEIMQWDGYINARRNSKQYLTTNFENAKWVQTMAHLSFQLGLLRTRSKGKDSYGTKPVYSVSVNDFISVRPSSIVKKEIPYQGNVYCFTTESGYFLCRYRDTIFVSGNCDGAMGARTMATANDIPEKLAKDLILQWRTLNVKSAAWQDRVGNAAQQTGETRNAFGRKRWYWSHSAYTEGIRFYPQSTGADILFRALIGLLYERIGWPAELALKVSPILAPLPRPARLVLTVHDSILIETPPALIPEVAKCLNATMTQGWQELGQFSIPIELKVGAPSASWAELLPYQIPQ